MRTSLNITNKLTKLAEMTGDSVFQVLEFDELNGGNDVDSAIKFKFMKDAGIKLKQIRIILEESAVKLESGALSYLKGDIELQNKVGGVLGFGKKLINSKLTGETVFNPVDCSLSYTTLVGTSHTSPVPLYTLRNPSPLVAEPMIDLEDFSTVNSIPPVLNIAKLPSTFNVSFESLHLNISFSGTGISSTTIPLPLIFVWNNPSLPNIIEDIDFCIAEPISTVSSQA